MWCVCSCVRQEDVCGGSGMVWYSAMCVCV